MCKVVIEYSSYHLKEEIQLMNRILTEKDFKYGPGLLNTVIDNGLHEIIEKWVSIRDI